MSATRALEGWCWRQFATWAQVFGQRGFAWRCWTRLRALRPHDPSPIEALAHLRATSGAHDEAIALYGCALAADPTRTDAWFNLGYLHQESGAHEQALEAFARALALDPRHDRALYGQGLSLMQLGKLEEGAVAFRRNAELQPMSPYGWYQLAHALHRLGRRDEAADAIGRLAGFEPDVARRLQRETGIEPRPRRTT